MQRICRIALPIGLFVTVMLLFASSGLAQTRSKPRGAARALPPALERIITARDMITAEIYREQAKIKPLMDLGVDRASLDQAIKYKKAAASALNRAIKEWPKAPRVLIVRARSLMQSASHFENEDILAASNSDERGTLHAQSIAQEAQAALEKIEPILKLLSEISMDVK